MFNLVSRNLFTRVLVGIIAVAIFGGCASSQIKARKDQRDKAAQGAKLYCDFVNGELYPDVEVMLNLEMAKRCDSEKAFSITNYKTSNENMGIVFCCALPDKGSESKESKVVVPKADVLAKPEVAKEAPKKEAAAKPAGDKPADKTAAPADDELGD